MKNLRKWFASQAALIRQNNELEATNKELAKQARALASVIDTMNYLKGMQEVECNVRMVLDQHGIPHKD